MLFFLFGDRADARVLPIATVRHGKLAPIALDAAGWRDFDRLYFSPTSQLRLYANGNAAGDANIRRGMWSEKPALYALPGCRTLRPLAAASPLEASRDVVMLELLATSDPLPPAPTRPHSGPADLDSARVLAARLGQHEGLTNAARADLDLNVRAVHTGASSHPTLVASYQERGSGGPQARHLFVLGDWSEAAHGYVQSYLFVADSTHEFRRFIDHADLTGDGIDEIAVEGWRSEGDSFLAMLRWDGTRWREIVRGPSSWCADPAAE
ncbi:MAG: hypothetical protein H0W68_11345 [Gemmatimonadaceae bacterium]|nr:hypothetical protein [Gemmatimonadaceae bacterium]